METQKSYILNEQRKQPRIFVQIECKFESDDKEYEALMTDLSKGGALLSLTEEGILAQESKISITLEDGEILKVPLKLIGTIKHNRTGVSAFGKVVKLGIEFENTPLELFRLISVLSKPNSKV